MHYNVFIKKSCKNIKRLVPIQTLQEWSSFTLLSHVLFWLDIDCATVIIDAMLCQCTRFLSFSRSIELLNFFYYYMLIQLFPVMITKSKLRNIKENEYLNQSNTLKCKQPIRKHTIVWKTPINIENFCVYTLATIQKKIFGMLNW